MAGGYKFQPQGVDAMVATIRDLQAQIDSLRQAITGLGINVDATTGNLIVGNGKGITVKDDGTVIVIDSSGVEVARFGALPAAFNEIGGSPQPGVRFLREDGTTAMFLGDLNPGTPPFKQSLQSMDRAGNIIFADDTNGGVGIANPYIPLGSFADITVPTNTTASATFVGMQWADCYQQHPKVTASVLVQTPAGTTGEIRITDVTNQIGSVVTVPSNSFGQFNIGPAAWPVGHYTYNARIVIQLEARVTGGAGTIGVRGLGLWGVQS